MSEHASDTKKDIKSINHGNIGSCTPGEKNRQFKKEVIGVFHKFGYLAEGKDYEVTFRITSGNIAWININSIEIIK